MKIQVALPVLCSVSLLLAGCGGFSMGDLNPFGSEPQELSRAPANAVFYQCDAGKRLYVRYPDGGAYVWVILPEREFRLDRVGPAPGTRYGTGTATLDRNGDQVTLSEGTAVGYTGCKVPAPVPAKASQDAKNVSQDAKDKGDKKK